MVEWELTRACDLSCAHCYQGSSRRRTNELSTSAALEMAQQLADRGCRSVTLSGGEPTLRPDWSLIAARLNELSVGVQLFSNGQRIDAAAAKAAAGADLRMVILSLDGIGPTHDHVRGKVGAFDQVVRAAGLLRAHGVAVGFNTVLLAANLAELEQLSKLVQRLDAALWTIWLGIASRPDNALWLGPADLVGLPARLRELRRSCPVLSVGDNLGAALGNEELRHPSACDHGCGPQSRGCPAADSVVGLRADGNLVGCLALPEARERRASGASTLVQQLSWARHQRQQRYRKILASCNDCSQLQRCAGGCHATALATGMDRSACIGPPALVPAHLASRRLRVAGVAASLFVAGAACNTQQSSTVSPSASAPATEVQVTVPPAPSGSSEETTSDALSTASASASTAATVSPSATPAPTIPTTTLAKPPGIPKNYPPCCMMHVLVPGCKCP